MDLCGFIYMIRCKVLARACELDVALIVRLPRRQIARRITIDADAKWTKKVAECQSVVLLMRHEECVWSFEVLRMNGITGRQEMGVGYVHGSHFVLVEFLW